MHKSLPKSKEEQKIRNQARRTNPCCNFVKYGTYCRLEIRLVRLRKTLYSPGYKLEEKPSQTASINLILLKTHLKDPISNKEERACIIRLTRELVGRASHNSLKTRNTHKKSKAETYKTNKRTTEIPPDNPTKHTFYQHLS